MLQLDNFYKARFVLSKVIRKTELVHTPRINPESDVYLKPECLQKTGSFKNYVGIHHLISSCIFHGKMRKNDMIPYLQKAHFFLFPTEEKREGQSNSLTETMSFGIIPIASSQGYNKSTIANDLLIEDTLTAKAYSDKIISIWDKGDVTNLSQEMYNRINTHFTYQQVKENISHIYAAIFTDKK